MRGEAGHRSSILRSRRLWALAAVVSLLGLYLAIASAPAAPATILIPFSTVPVANSDLDGNPTTGAWSDAGNWTIPLENGASSPYGSAQLLAKHDNTSIYFRIDGHMDVPWTSATATHFWLGIQVSPSGTSHHGSGTWEGAFFGLWDGSHYTPQPTYPPAVVETTGFGKPPTQNATNSDLGFMRFSGSGAPYAFTAEWKRPLTAGGLPMVADGTTSYHFFVTTQSNSGGANGGNINHGQITNVNVMRLASPGGSSPPPPNPPTVAVTAPTSGATVNGIVAVSATASSSAGIAHVDFYADATLLGSVTSAPYSVTWDTTGYTNGAHSLIARAYDPSNNVGTASVSVTVNHTALSVSILAPLEHSVVSGLVTITASAAGSSGVARVDFFVNNSAVGSAADTPYSVIWDTASAREGIHLLRAMASFSGGGARNATVHVLVDRTPRLAAPAIGVLGPGSLQVTWNASSDSLTVGYIVLRSGSPDGPFVALNADPLGNTTYVDLGLVAGASYYYEIETVDIWGHASLPSPAAGAAAGAPSLFDLTNLKWVAIPAGAAVILLILAVLIRRELRRRGQPLRERTASDPDPTRRREGR